MDPSSPRTTSPRQSQGRPKCPESRCRVLPLAATLGKKKVWGLDLDRSCVCVCAWVCDKDNCRGLILLLLLWSLWPIELAWLVYHYAILRWITRRWTIVSSLSSWCSSRFLSQETGQAPAESSPSSKPIQHRQQLQFHLSFAQTTQEEKNSRRQADVCRTKQVQDELQEEGLWHQ